jgi:hypothetical protein
MKESVLTFTFCFYFIDYGDQISIGNEGTRRHDEDQYRLGLFRNKLDVKQGLSLIHI